MARLPRPRRTRYGPPMADRERGGDYDDWFDEPEPPPARGRRGQRGAAEEGQEGDAWVLPEGETRRPPRRRREPLVVAGREVTQTQAAIVAVSAVVLLLAILAAAGVFSGGSPKTAPTVTTPPTAPPAVTPANTTPATTGQTVQAPATTLKPGDTGSQVTRLQKALASLGYSPGKADGSYGPGTKQAVTDFQTAQGLTADGVVGPKTLASLRQALAGG
jgi:hypothetical protein